MQTTTRLITKTYIFALIQLEHNEERAADPEADMFIITTDECSVWTITLPFVLLVLSYSLVRCDTYDSMHCAEIVCNKRKQFFPKDTMLMWGTIEIPSIEYLLSAENCFCYYRKKITLSCNRAKICGHSTQMIVKLSTNSSAPQYQQSVA